MNKFIKNKKIALLLVLLFIAVLVIMFSGAFVLTREDSEIVNPLRANNLKNTTNLVAKEVPEVDDESEEEVVLTGEYEEVVINDFATGLFVRELPKYRDFISSDEFCDGLDLNIFYAYYSDEENTGDGFTDRTSVGFEIANRKAVGDEEFEKFVQKFNDRSFFDSTMFNISCGGGAAYFKIDVPVEVDKFLDEQVVEIHIGGYQYSPSIVEAVGFTLSTFHRSEDNIIVIGIYFSEKDVLKFTDIKNIQSCIVEGDPQRESIDPECVAEIIKDDPESLQKLIDYAKEQLDGVIVSDL